MNADLRRIGSVLVAARRRWFWHTVLGVAARTLAAIAVIVVVAWAVVRLYRPQAHGTGATALVVVALAAVLGLVLAAAWSLRRRPSDAQVARFVEEHCPQLEDRLVTAVESAAGGASAEGSVFAELLYRDAAGRIAGLDLDEMISRRAVTRRALSASIAAVALAAVTWVAWPDIPSITGGLTHGVFAPRVVILVTPGNARVVANNSFTVHARVSNLPPDVRPALTVDGRQGRAERTMTRVSQDEFAYTFPQVTEGFRYAVRARSSRSRQYTVTLLNAARVARIDVRYEYPAGYGVPPRVEEDGGDVYGPPGTRVQLTVTADKPVRAGSLTMDDGTGVPLVSKGDRLLTGELKITDDRSYRVALTDREGQRNPGETEYFIRVLADAPPDVRIVKPAADRQVTPLEEVPIAAHADDDHGVKDFELVYSVRGGPEQHVPFSAHGDARSLDGTRVMYLEDLHVRPGDFVSYYARARDNAAGKASAEARSDIFFLEVTAFDDEFLTPPSQASGSGGMEMAGRSLEDLIRAQKAIVVATWKLDRRSRRSRSAGSGDDIRTVALAQGELRKRAVEAGGVAVTAARAKGGASEGEGDPMANAVEAMGQAEESLKAAHTADALPHETRALNELMRAQASQRRKQLMQASGGGGGDNGNSNPDLSTMFDRALQREQKTTYEMPQNQPRQEQQSDVLERLRQLAERQGELSQRQQDLDRDRAQLQADDFKRQLERLTREQSDLRQQAEQLAEQMRAKPAQRGSSGGEGQSRGGTDKAGDTADAAMRKASEAMRDAAARLRDGKLGEAGRQGQQALGRLQSAEDALRSRQDGAEASSLGEVQMEARRVADGQRQIAGQAAAAGRGANPSDSMRRLAGEKERLADQVERLQKDLKKAAASPGLQGHQRQALESAAVDFERLQVSRQMRDSAAAMRDSAKADVNRPESAAKEEDLAQTLDRFADRVGAASGSRASVQSSDRLARTRDIKERLAQLERQMSEAQAQADAGANGAKPARGANRGQGASDKAVATGGHSGDDSAARVEKLREEYQRELQRAAEHLDDLRRAGAVGFTPEGQGQQILSARGYNQDFSEWKQLSHGINAGLDRAESELSQKLRDQQARDRLQAPSAARAPEQYRRLVEEYYQSLAGKARK